MSSRRSHPSSPGVTPDRSAARKGVLDLRGLRTLAREHRSGIFGATTSGLAGSHLMDTLPSGEPQVGGSRSALACIRLSLSCPFRRHHTFQLLRPARPYPRAPHSSARGTSTLLSNALLSAQYGCRTRTHLGLDKQCLFLRQVSSIGRIIAIPQLGGLHHRYERVAAVRARKPFGYYPGEQAILGRIVELWSSGVTYDVMATD